MSNGNSSHRVWEFKGDGCTWIAWAVGYDPPTPAPGSAAALADLRPCNELAPSSMLDRAAATQLAALLRSIRRKEGLKVLAGRVYRGAGPHPRPTAGYRSIRAAAAAMGISRSAAARLADFDGCADSPPVPNLTILTDLTIPPIAGPE